MPYMLNTQHAYMGDICLYMPHMKVLASTKQLETLYTYLTYVMKQIWLPNSEHSPQSQHAAWACRPYMLHT